MRAGWVSSCQEREVIMTATSTSSVSPQLAGPGPSTRNAGWRRRSVPHLVVGVVLVTSCAAGGVWWSVLAGERVPALALARPVALGTVLAAGDLREVRVAVDGAVDVVPAQDASSVVGQRLTVSLPAGVLLPRRALGTPSGPPAGRAVAALALEPGQAPTDLGTGTTVLVVLTTDPNTAAAGAVAVAPMGGWRGLVTNITDITSGPSGQGRVVSIELGVDDARHVAAAPVGRLSLVVVGGGR